jgi:hypothetical protein
MENKTNMKIDFSIDESNIDNDFNRIANELMNHWVLKVDSKEYRITEIEFYLKSDIHDDNYTHGHDLQKEKEKWYFHGSGIDITFGSNNFYGGILIRAIYDLAGKKYIYGPLNSITEIFSNIKTVYASDISFGLIYDKNKRLEFEKPISAPRVGLNPLNNSGMYDKYLSQFMISNYAITGQKHAEPKQRLKNAGKQNENSKKYILKMKLKKSGDNDFRQGNK